MILVNRNFGTPALSTAIGDLFKPTSDSDQNIEWVNHTNVLASGSSLVSVLKNVLYDSGSPGGNGTAANANAAVVATHYDNFNNSPKNIYIVTEQFLKVLDKVYTKIWNESFTENGIYDPKNLSTLFNGFSVDTGDIQESNTNIMIFKKFVDRCITAGILQEEDRLQYEDQVLISDLNKTNISTQINLESKLITFTSAEPMNIQPDIDAREGHYLYGKKLFLMMTPCQTNEETIKNISYTTAFTGTEPFRNSTLVRYYNPYAGSYPILVNTPVRRPIAFFKPKTPESKFGRSLPLSTHFFWRIGTPEEREIALLGGKTGIDLPELIFDHTDRISHIDSFTLKIKFDKLQF